MALNEGLKVKIERVRSVESIRLKTLTLVAVKQIAVPNDGVMSSFVYQRTSDHVTSHLRLLFE